MDHFLNCKENATLLSYPKDLLPKHGWPTLENIKIIAVIGAGVMGQGIALSFLHAGFKTVLVDKDEQSLSYGLSQLWETVRKALGKSQFDKNIVQLLSDNLTFGINLNIIKNADFVVEAVYEDMNLKLALFNELDKICKSTAIICTNTSTLDINKMAMATNRPQHVVGMHFFNPAHTSTLVEVIHGHYTDKISFNAVVEITKRIQKVPVIVGNAPGFCGNRMCHSQFVEALKLVVQGVEPQYIDEVIKTNLGIIMGPFQMQDLVGLDTINRINNENNWMLHPILETLCKLGRFGRKSGKGWYLYKDGRRHIDPNLKNILKEKNLIQNEIRKPSPEEIIQILIYPMINEAFKIMEEKVVIAPEAVDLIWLLGYGWPLEKGGPMYWAEQQGLKNILNYLNTKSNSSPELYWKPSEMLKSLVAKGSIPLKDWTKNIPMSKL